MIVKRSEIVDSARSYKDVRFAHQGRTRRGLDCAGLLVRVGQDTGLDELAGIPGYDYLGYARMPNGQDLLDQLTRVLGMRKVSWDEAEPGDVLYFYNVEWCHLAILGGSPGQWTMIHATVEFPRRVVEHRINDEWLGRCSGVYRFKGL